jgi:hypothetical protein
MRIDAGAGGDTINVGSETNTLDSIQGAVTVYGAGGPVSLWKGDGNANDSLNRNNGTLPAGVTFAPGVTGATGDQAFSFNGSNALVDLGHDPSLDISGSLTVSAWVNVRSLNHYKYLFADFDSTGLLSQGSLGLDSTRQFFWFQGNKTTNGFVQPFGATQVKLNQWYHVAVVRDDNAKTVTLYVNGVQDASVSYAGLPVLPLQGDKLLGGSSPGFPNDSFDGLLDEVGLYNRALSATEIQNIFHSGGASLTNPVNTTLNVIDTGTTVSENYSVFPTSIRRSVVVAGVYNYNTAPINYYQLGNVAVHVGTAQTGLNLGGLNTLDVFGTEPGTITDLYGNNNGGQTQSAVAPYDSPSGFDANNQILGSVHFHGSSVGLDTLSYYDYFNPAGQQTYTLSGTATGGQIVDSGFATVTYDGPLYGASLYSSKQGGNTVNILSTAVATSIDSSTGDHVIAGMPVASGGRTLAYINRFLSIASVDGNPNVVPADVLLDDSADTTAHPAVLINGDAVYPGPDVVNLAPAIISWRSLAPTTPVTILGGSGGNTFAVNALLTIPLTLDGGGGTHNKLDYTGYTGPVLVSLPLGYATGFAGISRIQDVTGSIGNNLLVGDANPNILIGGTGRNVLIGGKGADTLDASRSHDDNILIGGWTNWDMNLAALQAIMKEWDRTEPGFTFAERRSDLLNGTNSLGLPPDNVISVNGVPTLVLLTPATNPTSSNGTVHGDGAMDKLIGANLINPTTGKRTVHNWFFYEDGVDVLVNFDTSSDRKNKVT